MDPVAGPEHRLDAPRRSEARRLLLLFLFLRAGFYVAGSVRCPDIRGFVRGSTRHMVGGARGGIRGGVNRTADHGGGRLNTCSRRAFGTLDFGIQRGVSVIVHVFSPLFSE